MPKIDPNHNGLRTDAQRVASSRNSTHPADPPTPRATTLALCDLTDHRKFENCKTTLAISNKTNNLTSTEPDEDPGCRPLPTSRL